MAQTMHANQGGDESPNSIQSFLQLIQQLDGLIADIPTEEATEAMALIVPDDDANEAQLKNWYDAMMDVLARCEVIVAGPFGALIESYLQDSSRKEFMTATKLRDQVQATLSSLSDLMSIYSPAVEPTMHSRIKKIITDSTGSSTREELEVIIDNEAKVKRSRGLLVRLAIYPRLHLEDSIRKMIHDIAAFDLATVNDKHHEESSGVSRFIQDQFTNNIMENHETVVFPVRTACQISARFEQLRFSDAKFLPTEKETKALDLQDGEEVKNWFFKMEDAVVEFDMLTKLLPLMCQQKYERASLDEIEELTAKVRKIVAPLVVWASNQEGAFYPPLMDVVSNVNEESEGTSSRVEIYEYNRIIQDEAAVQAALNRLKPLASHRKLRKGLRDVSQLIATFHHEHLDLRPCKMRRIEADADGFVNINPYSM